jgi:hypothetical protein
MPGVVAGRAPVGALVGACQRVVDGAASSRRASAAARLGRPVGRRGRPPAGAGGGRGSAEGTAQRYCMNASPPADGSPNRRAALTARSARGSRCTAQRDRSEEDTCCIWPATGPVRLADVAEPGDTRVPSAPVPGRCLQAPPGRPAHTRRGQRSHAKDHRSEYVRPTSAPWSGPVVGPHAVGRQRSP